MQFRRLERVASWKEGNFRSLLGRLHPRAEKGLLKAGRGQRPGGRGLRHWGQIGREKSRPARASGGGGREGPVGGWASLRAAPVGRRKGGTPAAELGEWNLVGLGCTDRASGDGLCGGRAASVGRAEAGRAERGCMPSNSPSSSPPVSSLPSPPSCHSTCEPKPLGSSDAREKPLVNRPPKLCDPVNFLGS